MPTVPISLSASCDLAPGSATRSIQGPAPPGTGHGAQLIVQRLVKNKQKALKPVSLYTQIANSSRFI